MNFSNPGSDAYTAFRSHMVLDMCHMYLSLGALSKALSDIFDQDFYKVFAIAAMMAHALAC